MGDIYKSIEDDYTDNNGHAAREFVTCHSVEAARIFKEEMLQSKRIYIKPSSIEAAAMTLLEQGWRWADVVKVLASE